MQLTLLLHARQVAIATKNGTCSYANIKMLLMKNKNYFYDQKA